ncbi:kinase-like domain-containing protein [Leucosporidium creatinivorum]|uniref:Kinase-like domain-containing protein n=1 Tax=Leucosporidium creatinivorum TaxID=106004 RepID=A0A1Y2FRT9_9BASI|nr:kinase-like domain-containing protein [Leucosporidium creatinivorum]
MVSPLPPPPTLFSYTIREQLATGGQATVYRARHPNGNLAAIKIVSLDLSQPSAQVKGKAVLREMRIHETLKHNAVLEMIGGEMREGGAGWPAGLWLLLALADGGDLFDKITPDVGISEDIAHLYFTQLISGLKYLGHQGICHRDIKPENCLLDANGNLKISDFGLATVFKYKGQSRLLRDRCGSPPYAAPELATTTPYAGQPVDVWSAGILLFTLLVGNTPWDQPTPSSPEFALYLSGEILKMEPWEGIGEGVLELLLQLLQVDPNKRLTIPQIEQNAWFVQPNRLLHPLTNLCTDGAEVCRRMASSLHQHGYLGAPSGAFEELTQNPTPMNFSQRGLDPNASFRSSLQLYSKLSMAPTQRANPNLTRFFTTLPVPTLVQHLTQSLTTLGVSHSVLPTPDTIFLTRVKITGLDKRGEKCEGSITVAEGCLPDVDGGRIAEEEEGGEGMEVDGEEGMGKGTKGFDVVMWKKVADPLELKRLWMRIVQSLPREVVFATEAYGLTAIDELSSSDEFGEGFFGLDGDDDEDPDDHSTKEIDLGYRFGSRSLGRTSVAPRDNIVLALHQGSIAA